MIQSEDTVDTFPNRERFFMFFPLIFHINNHLNNEKNINYYIPDMI